MKYILIKSQIEFKAVAENVRLALNIKDKNKSPHRIDQERYGINRGGDYYLFEILGIEIYLLRNEGEVLLEGYEEYTYYIYMALQFEFGGTKFPDLLTEYITLVLKENNLEVVVIEE